MKDFKGKIPTFKFDVKGQRGELPQVGLGTAGLDGERCVSAVVEALKQGYRVIDTALLYGNQLEVGEGVRKSGLDRKDVWITSKVAFFPPNSDDLWGAADHKGLNDKGGEEASIDLTLKQLGVDYLDLLLIHNPAASKEEYSAAAHPHFFEMFTYQGKEEAVRPERLPDGDNIRDLIAQGQATKSEGGKYGCSCSEGPQGCVAGHGEGVAARQGEIHRSLQLPGRAAGSDAKLRECNAMCQPAGASPWLLFPVVTSVCAIPWNCADRLRLPPLTLDRLWRSSNAD